MYGHQRTATALILKSSQPRKEPRHKYLQNLLIPPADLANEMLTEPPVESSVQHQNKELRRIKKWRDMAGTDQAKRTRSGSIGGGMKFSFDTTDSKVISRTWKGIPDCWRASAWHSFLSASARKKGGCLSDSDLISIYHVSRSAWHFTDVLLISHQDLISQNNADDVQIDLDVPRTINSHIMFRKRYRGG